MKPLKSSSRKLVLKKIKLYSLSPNEMAKINGGAAFFDTTIKTAGGPQGGPVKIGSRRTCASGFDGGCGTTNCF